VELRPKRRGRWKTVGRVSSQTPFSPGDSILLKAGNTCTYVGQLYPKGSGISGNPIQIDKYGAGSNPVISANGTGMVRGSQGTIYLHNQSQWEIHNVVVTNCLLSGSPAVCIGAQGNWNNQALRAQLVGIQVINDSGTQLHHIYIQNNTVQYVSGLISGLGPPNGPCGGNCPWNNGAIALLADYTTAPASRFDDINISNNLIQHVDSEGIEIGILKQLTSFDNIYSVLLASPNTNIVVNSNTIEDAGAHGVQVFLGNTSSIVSNTIKSCGHRVGLPGIEVEASFYTTLQSNEIYDQGVAGVGQDRYAIDVDWGSNYTTVQYNYSHSNYEGFVLVWEPHQRVNCTSGICGTQLATYQCDSENTYNNGLAVRWNVTVDDGAVADTGVFAFCGYGRDRSLYFNCDYNAFNHQENQLPWGPSWPIFENNTILLDINAHAPIIKQCSGSSVLKVVGNNGNPVGDPSLVFYNNLIEELAAPLNGELSWTQAINLSVFDYNSYYGTFSNLAPGYCSLTKTTSCSYSVYCPAGETCVNRSYEMYRDPLLVNPFGAVNGNYPPIGRTNLGGMQLRSTSSELTSGCNPTFGPCGSWTWTGLGAADFWGNGVVPNANPSRGAYDGAGN